MIDLEAIRERANADLDGMDAFVEAVYDRRALLAEVDRLRAALDVISLGHDKVAHLAQDVLDNPQEALECYHSNCAARWRNGQWECHNSAGEDAASRRCAVRSECQPEPQDGGQ